MIAIQPTEALSAFGLLAAALAMTAVSLWSGARMTPWFLREAVEGLSVRTLFLSEKAGEGFLRVRVAAVGLSFVVMLSGLLAIAIAARLAGWSPAL